MMKRFLDILTLKKTKTRNSDETDFLKYPILIQKLELPYNRFETSDIYIIESGTGAGKSSLIVTLYKEYKANHQGSKILMTSNFVAFTWVKLHDGVLVCTYRRPPIVIRSHLIWISIFRPYWLDINSINSHGPRCQTFER